MNRFEQVAENISKKWGVAVEHSPQNISHKYVVEGRGARDAKDAEKIAREIYQEALHQHGNY